MDLQKKLTVGFSRLPQKLDKLLDTARLQRIIQPFLVTNRRKRLQSIIMPRINLHIIVKLHELVEQAIIHASSVSARQICPATFADEKRVASQQFLPINKKAHAVRSVPRSVNYFDVNGADNYDVAVAYSHVGNSSGQLVGNGFGSEEALQLLVSRCMVRVTVSAYDIFQFETFSFKNTPYLARVVA